MERIEAALNIALGDRDIPSVERDLIFRLDPLGNLHAFMHGRCVTAVEIPRKLSEAHRPWNRLEDAPASLSRRPKHAALGRAACIL
jgi:hypothetical protein